MSKAVLFINPKSGRSKQKAALETFVRAARQQPDLEVHLIEKGQNPLELFRRAIEQGAKVIGAAGGDGTINAAATVLINSDVTLVPIPFGTLNLTARDLGIPSNAEQALNLFQPEHSQERRIDVGEVNGHYFLHNSQIGFYPRMLEVRARYEAKLGRWRAYLKAARLVLRHPSLKRLRFKLDGSIQELKVAMVLVSNGQVSLSPLTTRQTAEQPARFNDQKLTFYIIKSGSIWQSFWAIDRFLRNKLEESPLVEKVQVEELSIFDLSHRPYTRVACDGEVWRVQSPLHYRVHPAALRVRLPLEEQKSSKNSST